MASTAAVASAAEVGHGAVGALVGPRGPRGEKAWAEDVSGLSDRLDDLASRAFSPPRGDDPEAEAARARHLIAALFAPPRPADAADSATRTDRKPLPRPLRSEPTEFLYDGMDKVLIPSVLARAGGTPAGLAAVAAAVAARVAVPCAVLTPASARAAAAGMGGVGILGVGEPTRVAPPSPTRPQPASGPGPRPTRRRVAIDGLSALVLGGIMPYSLIFSGHTRDRRTPRGPLEPSWVGAGRTSCGLCRAPRATSAWLLPVTTPMKTTVSTA